MIKIVADWDMPLAQWTRTLLAGLSFTAFSVNLKAELKNVEIGDSSVSEMVTLR
jgi:hypothetical protein